MNSLIEGRIVHYVGPTGQHKPALVVNVVDKENGLVNLQVFLDQNGTDYVACAGFSEEPEPEAETWHWIEQEVAPEPTLEPTV